MAYRRAFDTLYTAHIIGHGLSRDAAAMAGDATGGHPPFEEEEEDEDPQGPRKEPPAIVRGPERSRRRDIYIIAGTTIVSDILSVPEQKT